MLLSTVYARKGGCSTSVRTSSEAESDFSHQLRTAAAAGCAEELYVNNTCDIRTGVVQVGAHVHEDTETVRPSACIAMACWK